MADLYNYRAGGLQPGRNSGLTHSCIQFSLIINGAEPAPNRGGRLAVGNCTSLDDKIPPKFKDILFPFAT